MAVVGRLWLLSTAGVIRPFAAGRDGYPKPGGEERPITSQPIIPRVKGTHATVPRLLLGAIAGAWLLLVDQGDSRLRV